MRCGVRRRIPQCVGCSGFARPSTSPTAVLDGLSAFVGFGGAESDDVWKCTSVWGLSPIQHIETESHRREIHRTDGDFRFPPQGKSGYPSDSRRGDPQCQMLGQTTRHPPNPVSAPTVVPRYRRVQFNSGPVLHSVVWTVWPCLGSLSLASVLAA